MTRTVRDTKPPQVDYALTPRGLSLLEVVRTLSHWAEDNTTDVLAAKAVFDAR